MPEKNYKERQIGLEKWWWLIVLFSGSFYGYYATSNAFIISNFWTWFLLGSVGLVLLMLVFTMWIVIDQRGVHIRYFPFIILWKTFEWAEIKSIKIEKYKPLREFGGWGMRIGLANKIAYTVYGKQALIITLKKSKKKIYIGTQKGKQMVHYFNSSAVSVPFSQNIAEK